MRGSAGLKMLVAAAGLCACRSSPPEEERLVSSPDGPVLGSGSPRITGDAEGSGAAAAPRPDPLDPDNGLCVPLPSVAATPDWARHATSNSRMPQLHGLSLAELPHHPGGPLEGDVLLCRIEAPADRWPYDVPDFLFHIVVEGHCRVSFRGGDDALVDVLSLAGVSLREGQSIALEARDRDVLGTDPVGRLDLVYAGTFPLAAANEHLSAVCQAVPREQAEFHRAEAVAAAESQWTQSAAALEVDLTARDLGYSRLRAHALRSAILHVAAWAGWQDASALDLSARYASLEQRWREATDEALAARWAETTPGGEPVVLAGGRLEATAALISRADVRAAFPGATLLDREHREIPWAVALTVRAASDEPVLLSTRGFPVAIGPWDSFELLELDGDWPPASPAHPLEAIAFELDAVPVADVGEPPWFETEVRSGQTVRLLAAPREVVHLGRGQPSEQTFLRLRTRSGYEWVRLDVPLP